VLWIRIGFITDPDLAFYQCWIRNFWPDPERIIPDPDPGMTNMQNKFLITNFLAKNLVLIIEHIFTILNLLNLIY